MNVLKNKKAMLGNIIGGFIVLLVGMVLLPTISNEINKAITCNQTNETISNITGQPLGDTNSFGGGGAGHFGGYDGTIKKSWSSKYSLIPGNQSIFNKNCVKVDNAQETLLNLVPIFFALTIGIISIFICFSSLRESGLV